MTKRGRTKKQIIKTIFKLFNREKELYLSSFRKIGLNNHSARGYIDIINFISQQINQTDIIEVIKIGKTTRIKLNKFSSTINSKNTNTIQADSDITKNIQAIELQISKLAFLIQTGESTTRKY